MIEVELKARLGDREAVQARVAAFARYSGPVDKFDSYWHEPDWRRARGAKGFRVRDEGGSSVVTFKTKRVEAGVEVNLEREFGVGDPDIFVEFCRRLGCEPFYTKRKRGSRYVYDPPAASAAATGPRPGAQSGESAAAYSRPATIEIIEVEGLGDFIEIEILLENEEPAALAAAQAELRGLLERAGVSASEIESRFYSELLMAAGKIPPA
ncbi:MAG TPA: CYTH domain-containing protein [Rectinemataceae bacterium]|nr:CYTH domain-containing protein [Rectinemataceae bacterium]